MFMIASVVARAMRFFLIAALIWKYGAPIKTFIDKYFNLLASLFTVLLVGFTLLAFYIIGDSGSESEARPAQSRIVVPADRPTLTSAETLQTADRTCDASGL